MFYIKMLNSCWEIALLFCYASGKQNARHRLWRGQQVCALSSRIQFVCASLSAPTSQNWPAWSLATLGSGVVSYLHIWSVSTYACHAVRSTWSDKRTQLYLKLPRRILWRKCCGRCGNRFKNSINIRFETNPQPFLKDEVWVPRFIVMVMGHYTWLKL